MSSASTLHQTIERLETWYTWWRENKDRARDDLRERAFQRTLEDGMFELFALTTQALRELVHERREERPLLIVPRRGWPGHG